MEEYLEKNNERHLKQLCIVHWELLNRSEAGRNNKIAHLIKLINFSFVYILRKKTKTDSVLFSNIYFGGVVELLLFDIAFFIYCLLPKYGKVLRISELTSNKKEKPNISNILRVQLGCNVGHQINFLIRKASNSVEQTFISPSNGE